MAAKFSIGVTAPVRHKLRATIPADTSTRRRHSLPTATVLWLGLAIAVSIPGRAADSGEIQSRTSTPEASEYELNLDPALWQLGGTAQDDVIAPVAFTSVDPEASMRLQEEAAIAVTPIYRFVPAIAGEALAAFDSAIAQNRSKFVAALSAAFAPPPLDAKTFLDSEFEAFSRRWIDEHFGTFSPPVELTRAWALDADDAPVLQPWREVLSAFMSDYRICAAEAMDTMGTSTCRIVTTDSPVDALTMADVASQATVVEREHLWTLDQARENFRRFFAATGPAAPLVAAFVRPNTYPETDLTELERSRIPALVSAPPEEHPAGTVILRRGDLIGPRAHAALADLRVQLAALVPRDAAPTVEPQPPAAAAEAVPTPPESAPAPTNEIAAAPVQEPMALDHMILIGVFLILGLVTLVSAWKHYRDPRGSALALASVPEPEPEPESPVVLALRDATVQQLYSHRQALLDEQDKSTAQVSDLEARVARLQPQIQDRIRTYEERIRELEAMLSAQQQASPGAAPLAPASNVPRRDRNDPRKSEAVQGAS